ncbi:hypothetical protein QTH90_31295 [Variovorax sp. J2P1-59]|uniref:hypothetical protein n=1 Tax=Variovorax flavidus TaxID=3053501 RepID=UPI002575A6D9|nr:hypothetical protein [Variovorax sp. J2P1-59]MDM0078927.1 hypothetical protein [Variovorax sp. J2P1-59]
MIEFLLGASAFVLLTVAARLFSAPSLLLLGAAIGAVAVVDLARILALLAAFAAQAFVKVGRRSWAEHVEPEDRS